MALAGASKRRACYARAGAGVKPGLGYGFWAVLATAIAGVVTAIVGLVAGD